MTERRIDVFFLPSLVQAGGLRHQAVVVIDKRRFYGEERRMAYGPVDGRLYALVYTLRGDRRRIISFRKANRREQATYAAGAPG